MRHFWVSWRGTIQEIHPWKELCNLKMMHLGINTAKAIFLPKWPTFGHCTKRNLCRWTLKPEAIFGNWKPFKIDEKCFLFHLKNSSRSQDTYIFVILCWILGHFDKRVDQKGIVNFKIYDVTTWLTNNCNTHVDQYLKK